MLKWCEVCGKMHDTSTSGCPIGYSINSAPANTYTQKCDVCKTEYSDIMEVQEFHHINFTGGYGSVFGDGNKVSCSICQHCLYKLIKEFIKIETYYPS